MNSYTNRNKVKKNSRQLQKISFFKDEVQMQAKDQEQERWQVQVLVHTRGPWMMVTMFDLSACSTS